MGLDEKAVEAVATWMFKPGVKDGVPVPVKANIDVHFRMR
jgi:outer membrane biosynthesis protein TonB